MKICIAVIGSNSDVRTCLGLAVKLKDNGISVTILSSPENEKLCSQNMIPFFGVGTEFSLVVETWQTFNRANIKKIVDSQISDSIKYFSNNNCDLVIGNPLYYAGPTICDYYSMSYIFLSPIPHVYSSGYYPPAPFPFQNLPRIINKLLWAGADAVFNLVLSKPVNKYRKQLGLIKPINLTRYYAQSKVILPFDRSIFTLPPDVHGNYLQTGYWDFDNHEIENLPDDLDSFISNRAEVIFFGFGSVPLYSKKARYNLEKTIEMILEKTDMKIVLYKGWSNIGANLPKHEKLYIMHSFVPYRILFPKMKAIIQSAGFGGIYKAICAEVPQIVIPFFIDQYFWANQIEKLNIGKSISKNRVTPERIMYLLKIVLNDKTIHDSIKSQKNQLEKENGIDTMVKHLQSNYFSKKSVLNARFDSKKI